MQLTGEEFVDRLLNDEAIQEPCDKVKADDLEMKLPDDFDEKKFNRGREFYWENCFMLTTSMLLGLVAVLAVPSILKVLINSRRSSTPYTAYKRYISTIMHVVSWFGYDLEPNSVSWRSLQAVRSRHVRASMSSKFKGAGIISQKDLALTMFGFVGFSIVKPDSFGVISRKPDDWESYNYFWRVIGQMIGMQDRYNLCRETMDETRETSQILLDRVFTPCMENPPEYFEHMARAMLEGLSCLNITIDKDAILFATKRLCNVPGYVYMEGERLALQNRLRKQLKGQSEDIGVDVSTLISKPAVDGLPKSPPRLLYIRDYDVLETVPTYKILSLFGRFKLYFQTLSVLLYTTYLGRLYYNFNYHLSLFLITYFPYLAFIKFGVLASYINMFVEDPVEDADLLTNEEYYRRLKKKNKKSNSWYKEFVRMFK